VCFSATANFVGQRSSGRRRRRHLDKGEAQARTAFRDAAHAICRSSVHRGIRLAGTQWHSFACGGARHGCGVHALRAGVPPFFAAAKRTAVRTDSEEPQANAAVPRARRSNYALYFVGADGIPIVAVCQRKQYRVHQPSDKQYSGCVALCDCNLWLLFFSKIKMMVLFGAANLAILLVVMEVKRYAFTSLWCSYAAVASVIILVYFWRSHGDRPLLYA
jgi:hypothetical protein